MLLTAFGGGILLSLTPCVYPMIGITVAVIGGQNTSKGTTIRRTFAYVLGLSLVYALLGVLVASIGSSAASFFRSPWVLIPIGMIFVLLGLSMFDLFTLQTPSAVSSKVTRLKINNVGGAFLVGGLSAFAVGPCVSGPVLGLITYVATTGNQITGFWLLFALAWGMSLILFIAGTASSALPRSGMWMERIKHTLGVVLIWAAFYFTRPVVGETGFTIASIIAVALGLQALGLLKLPEGQSGWKPMLRLGVSVLVLGIGIYIILPDKNQTPAPDKQIELSKVLQQEQPVILDFRAPWCTICKEIEETTLQEPAVQKALEDYHFVKVDYDSNPHLVEKFNIIGPPAFVFLNSKGEQKGDTLVTGNALKARLLDLERKAK
jgi:thiol:disulfide interchange protein DsbD